ncbi:MAG: monovalent cation/H(+) antiporter subunit G [Phycisphaerales bacterium]
MQTFADILAAFCLTVGLFFLFVGAVGIVRFPDAYNRLHAASKCSTLGLLGLLLGAVFHLGALAVMTKAMLTLIFAFVATPVGSHILARAAHIDGLEQWDRTRSDDLAVDQPDRPVGCPSQRREDDRDQRPPGAAGGGDRSADADRRSAGGPALRLADDAA